MTPVTLYRYSAFFFSEVVLTGDSRLGAAREGVVGFLSGVGPVSTSEFLAQALGSVVDRGEPVAALRIVVQEEAVVPSPSSRAREGAVQRSEALVTGPSAVFVDWQEHVSIPDGYDDALDLLPVWRVAVVSMALGVPLPVGDLAELVESLARATTSCGFIVSASAAGVSSIQSGLWAWFTNMCLYSCALSWDDDGYTVEVLKSGTEGDPDAVKALLWNGYLSPVAVTVEN